MVPKTSNGKNSGVLLPSFLINNWIPHWFWESAYTASQNSAKRIGLGFSKSSNLTVHACMGTPSAQPPASTSFHQVAPSSARAPTTARAPTCSPHPHPHGNPWCHSPIATLNPEYAPFKQNHSNPSKSEPFKQHPTPRREEDEGTARSSCWQQLFMSQTNLSQSCGCYSLGKQD